MYTTLLVLDVVVIAFLVGVILLQKSEGGGLGLGTSSKGMFTARGAAGFLNKTTLVLGAAFFTLSIVLVILGRPKTIQPPSRLDTSIPTQTSPAPPLESDVPAEEADSSVPLAQ